MDTNERVHSIHDEIQRELEEDKRIAAFLLKSEIEHWGPYQIPVKCVNALCPDGKQRTVKITGQADTAFSIPASVQYKGKTVAGFVSHESRWKVYEFHPYTYRKNGKLLQGDHREAVLKRMEAVAVTVELALDEIHGKNGPLNIDTVTKQATGCSAHEVQWYMRDKYGWGEDRSGQPAEEAL